MDTGMSGAELPFPVISIFVFSDTYRYKALMSRIIHCQDALDWLRSYSPSEGVSFVSSMPDISEFSGWSLERWQEWFMSTAELILSRTSDDGVTIFYQSDIKYEGTWVDKGHLCQKAAEKLGHKLLWHKIICRTAPGTVTFGRPAYSHILCFSKNLRVDPAHSTADVLAVMGEKTWERGMGSEACKMIAQFISERTKSHTMVNPFCGEGSMIKAAEACGLHAVGIERSPKRAARAQNL